MKSLTLVGSVLLASAVPFATVYADDRASGESSEKHQSQYEAIKSDFKKGWIEGKIETAYLLNIHLNNFKLDVDVDEGRAVVTGSVSESIQRDLAEQIALSVDGVDEVENKIVVDAHSSQRLGKGEEPSTTNKFTQTFADATITASAKLKLIKNDHIKGMAINVDTKNGQVTLSGHVKSELHRDLAEQMVENIDDVISVKNNLKVIKENSRG